MTTNKFWLEDSRDVPNKAWLERKTFIYGDPNEPGNVSVGLELEWSDGSKSRRGLFGNSERECLDCLAQWEAEERLIRGRETAKDETVV
jgi:hypothetical protein